MSDVSYRPLIDDMTWSYSRVNSFEDCPYAWYLKYVYSTDRNEQGLFFSSYGKFMHELLADFFRGSSTRNQLAARYAIDFLNEVKGSAPSRKIFSSYFQDGLNAIHSLKPFQEKVVAVEEKLDFEVNGKPCIGFVDLILEGNDGLIIVDHKSRNLKPLSKKATPTKNDELVHAYLRQLYLYSYAYQKMHQKPIIGLWLHCFRQNSVIKVPFDKHEQDRVLQWFYDTTETIADTTEFPPNMDFWRCRYLCGQNDQCEYFEAERR